MILLKFLRELIENIPYKIKFIQVDGGSEFMKDFEKACEELNIPLFEKSREVTGSSERNFMMISLKIPLLAQEENSRNL